MLDERTLRSWTDACGLLMILWFNTKNKIVCFNYGSAFAVTERLLITCAHNIYSPIRGFCSEVYFFPGVGSGTLQNRESIKSAQGIFYRSLIPQSSLQNQPLKEELALIALEKDVKAREFFKIGKLDRK